MKSARLIWPRSSPLRVRTATFCSRHFLVADDDLVGQLLQTMFPNFIGNFLIPQVGYGAQTGLFQLARDHALGIVRLVLGDVQHHHLDRREPQRHRPGVVLDQDADEALERAEDRPVQHDRHVARVVLARRTPRPSRSGIEKSSCMVPHCHTRPMLSFSENSILGP